MEFQCLIAFSVHRTHDSKCFECPHPISVYHPHDLAAPVTFGNKVQISLINVQSYNMEFAGASAGSGPDELGLFKQLTSLGFKFLLFKREIYSQIAVPNLGS